MGCNMDRITSSCYALIVYRKQSYLDVLREVCPMLLSFVRIAALDRFAYSAMEKSWRLRGYS